MVEKLLVDARNFDQLAPRILDEIRAAPLIGFDIETEDSRRHDGLNRFMAVDEEGKKSSGKKLVFDTRKTTVTGFSIYPDQGEIAYYLNLAHADVENRIPWRLAKPLLDAKQPDGYWIAHNAPFELCMMQAALGYDLGNIICTLQMAVSAYGPDEYGFNQFVQAGLGGIAKLIKPIQKAFANYDPSKGRDSMTAEQAELFAKVIAKESSSEWSYNGFVDSINYGYDLKKAVRSWFGVQMDTFLDTLGDNAHMGQLTGEEVAAYGADDSYWAVQLYHKILAYMLENNPAVVETYFKQELPMVPVYAESWRTGLRINLDAVNQRRALERHEAAENLRRMKKAVQQLLPFDTAPNQKMVEREGWYAKNNERYRGLISTWGNSADSTNDFEQCQQVRGPVSNAWAADLGQVESTGPNFSHYMPMRVLLYDLIGTKMVIEKGKVQSDAECRGRIQIRLEKRIKEIDEELPKIQIDPYAPGGGDGANEQYLLEQERARLTAGLEIVKCLAAIAGVEQRMKLYLTPYSMLTDPETGRVYPVLSSMLATRRMAMTSPNGMQLAKRGESTYVRGFYEADEDDWLICSSDWSSIELVEIGDMSGDPEFAKAFGQIPYEDLHAGAAADVLSVEVTGLTEAIFKSFKGEPIETLLDFNPRLATNLKGELMENGSKAVSYWRTEVGKGSNFNYWYSGALATVGQRMGWSSDMMWEATDKYRTRFAVAEAWRVAEINNAVIHGYTALPDGHRRYKFEVTQFWREIMAEKFRSYHDQAILNFGNEVIKAVHSRAKNQIINSKIQGTCATLVKRSIPRTNDRIRKEKLKARFMIPIHDELLYCVHRKDAMQFIPMMREVMCDHPDIIKTLPIHATTSIGRTFEPFDPKKAPLGQIELDEAPGVDWLPDRAGQVLTDAERQLVIDYFYSQPLQKAA